MRRPSAFLGLALGGMISLPFIALSYLGRQWAGLPFVPFDVFDWLARMLPGRMISAGIDLIVRVILLLHLGPIDSAAKRIEQLLGVGIVVAAAALLGVMMAFILRRTSWRGDHLGAAVGAGIFLVVAAVDIELRTSISAHPAVGLLWLAFVNVGWGTAVGAWLGSKELGGSSRQMTEASRAGRRALLLKLAGTSLGAALAAWGVARFAEGLDRVTGAGKDLARVRAAIQGGSGGEATPAQLEPSPASVAAAARDTVAPALGTRPEITPNSAFYRIDIDTRAPVIEEDSWAVEVSGLFDHPRRLTFTDILTFPSVTQPITLCCISNPIGEDLISTSNWTGVSLRVVLKSLGLRPEARGLLIRAADGFYESVIREDMLDPRTLLVYGMNGETLPVEHGFPLRIYISNRYGMKQPKWITAMEAIDHPGRGYWVDRGWSVEARPRIVSIIDTVAKDHMKKGQVPIGGIAWAGDRGIRKVEVQVDGGPWAAATLRTPPLGPLTWVEWRYDWQSVPGKHTFRVRAIDGTGSQQSGAGHDSFPDGATGYHSVSVRL